MARWASPDIVAAALTGDESAAEQLVAAVRSISVNPETCRCEVLFNEHSPSTYWIWTIPLSDSDTVRKFAVNAKTLEVVPLVVR